MKAFDIFINFRVIANFPKHYKCLLYKISNNAKTTTCMLNKVTLEFNVEFKNTIKYRVFYLKYWIKGLYQIN